MRGEREERREREERERRESKRERERERGERERSKRQSKQRDYLAQEDIEVALARCAHRHKHDPWRRREKWREGR